MQFNRVPTKAVAEAFADVGLKIHFGGHMHINDTGVHTSEQGNTLFNIQVPSPAAYKPGYKVLTIHSSNKVEIETVTIDTVPQFDELFPLYEMEHAHLLAEHKKDVWDSTILQTKSYGEFAQWHLKELVRLRFIPEDWPKEFSEALLKRSGKELLFLPKKKRDLKKVVKELAEMGLTETDFEHWSGFDMIYDFYRLRGADELAFQDIGEEKVKQYRFVCTRMAQANDPNYRVWATIFEGTLKGEPANHITIDVKTGDIKGL
jgi:hypothetical protein